MVLCRRCCWDSLRRLFSLQTVVVTHLSPVSSDGQRNFISVRKIHPSYLSAETLISTSASHTSPLCPSPVLPSSLRLLSFFLSYHLCLLLFQFLSCVSFPLLLLFCFSFAFIFPFLSVPFLSLSSLHLIILFFLSILFCFLVFPFLSFPFLSFPFLSFPFNISLPYISSLIICFSFLFALFPFIFTFLSIVFPFFPFHFLKE